MAPTVKHVDIIDDHGEIGPGQNTVKLSIRNKDEVEWKALTAASVVIFDKDGCPFHNPPFDVPARGSKRSGPPSVPAGTKLPRTYNYRIRGPRGEKDPAIIIDR